MWYNHNMRLKLALLTVLLLTACGPTNSFPSPGPTGSPFACILPGDPGSHVYNPDRLVVIDPANPCRSVTGIIDFIRQERDGDYHIGLKLDPQYADLVNSC